MNAFENDYLKIWVEQGVLHLVYTKKTIATLEVAKEVVRERLKVSNGRSLPMFVDIRNLKSTDKQARSYFAEGDGIKHINAGAFLVHNEIIKLLGNIFIKVDRPAVPAKLFTDSKNAMAWLQKFKYSNN